MKATLEKKSVFCNSNNFTVYERPMEDGSLALDASARVVESPEFEDQPIIGLGLDDGLVHQDSRSSADISEKKKKKKSTDAPAWARLKGLLLKRLKGKAIWVKLDFKEFEKLTGISERQIRRAKKTLEENDQELVFRTVLKRKASNECKEQNRGWEVIVALKSNLKYDEEPLFEDTDGSSRCVRENLLSSNIERLPDTPSIDKGPKGQQKETTTAGPKFNFFVNNFQLFPETPKIRKFAHFLKRILKNRHWDNCKIIFRQAHAYNYILKGLRMGADRDDIIFAYCGALETRHADATDYGLNNGNHTLKWEPSSTVTLAMEVLKKIMKRKAKGIL